MKLIIAMIRPDRLEAVREALDEYQGLRMYAGLAADVWQQQVQVYRGAKYQVAQSRMRLEVIVVNEMFVPEIVATIHNTAGDIQPAPRQAGDIFVVHVDDWVPIRAHPPAAADGPAHEDEVFQAQKTECVSLK